MKFEELANYVLVSQTEKDTKILADLFSENYDSAHDITMICCRPLSSIKPHHVVRMLAQSYGLFPEEYEQLMDEHEMPALLASESPPTVEKSLTLREVIELKEIIYTGGDVNADILFNSMSQLSAMVFWGYAFGKNCLSHKRIMQAVASITKYDTNHLQRMRTIMPTGEIIQRALKETLPNEYTIEPAYPFKAPHYSRWNRWSLPFKQTHYEIVRGKGYYAHRRGDAVFCFDSAARRVNRSPAFNDTNFDFVCEMDEAGNIVEWLYTDNEPTLWKKHRSKRVDKPKEVKDRAHLRALVQSLDDGEMLRLIDAERAYFHSGAVGGFIVPRRTFDLPLLILGGYRDGEGIRVKIAALDGFDTFPVGYAFVKADDIPERLARLYDAQSMIDIDEGLIGIFHALSYDHDTKTLRAPYLTRIDTTLGQSDAIQIGDLMER